MDIPSLPTTVHAGFPSPGEEYREPLLDLRRLLGLAGEGSFCHSMPSSELSAAGISPQDLLIATPDLEAAHQDIVVAQVNNRLWVRRLIRSADTIFLVPEDPANPTATRISILPTDHFHILGVVLCTIHALNETARVRLGYEVEYDINVLLGLDQPEIFCVRVRGSSMQPSGIYDTDALIVDRSRKVNENDIIIASLNGSFFVKRFVRTLGTIFLLSDNPLSAPIPVSSQHFQVWGVVLYTVHILHPALRQPPLDQRRIRR